MFRDFDAGLVTMNRELPGKMPRAATMAVAVLMAVIPKHGSAQHVARTTADIAADVSKATVYIETHQRNGDVLAGSGFLIDSSGTVVTNFHVVANAAQVQVRLPDAEVFRVSSVRAVDKERDLAILQIPAFGLATVAMGNSNNMRTGDRVIAIGTALGVYENTVTAGIISGIRDAAGTRVFQMDAAISPGNSGGPVVNDRGEVIGIATFREKAGESLNFAVPINYVRGMLQLTASNLDVLKTEPLSTQGKPSSPDSTPKVPSSMPPNERDRVAVYVCGAGVGPCRDSRMSRIRELVAQGLPLDEAYVQATQERDAGH